MKNGIEKILFFVKSNFNVEKVRICRDSKTQFYIKKDLLLFNNGVYLSGEEVNEDFLNL